MFRFISYERLWTCFREKIKTQGQTSWLSISLFVFNSSHCQWAKHLLSHAILWEQTDQYCSIIKQRKKEIKTCVTGKKPLNTIYKGWVKQLSFCCVSWQTRHPSVSNSIVCVMGITWHRKYSEFSQYGMIYDPHTVFCIGCTHNIKTFSKSFPTLVFLSCFILPYYIFTQHLAFFFFNNS